MNMKKRVPVSIVCGLLMLLAGCVMRVGPDHPREGFYDRDHHRYFHDNAWHECVERDEHCR